MEENVTTIVKGEKKYFQKISINMIQCILDFTNYKDYTNYVFTNPRFVKALQTIISRKSDHNIDKLNLSKLSMGKNGCYVIAHLIDLNRTLEEIDLSSNDLMYDEIYMLFSKYKQNKHHLSINLLKNNLNAECLKYISNIVKDDLYKTITVNKISRNLSKAVNCWSIVQK